MGLIDPSVSKGELATNRTANKPKRSASSLTAGGVFGTISSHVGLQSGATWLIRQIEKALGWRLDAAPTYLFYVEISGLIVALFTECSGLKGKRQVETVREGGVNDLVHHLPGPIEFDNIVLKRGLSLSRTLYGWFMEGQYDFRVKKHNLSIIQGAPGHNIAANVLNMIPGVRGNIVGGGFGKIKHWDVEEAYPVKWQMSDLDTSKGTSAVIETLELVHHGVSLSWDALTPLSLVQSTLASAAKPLENLITPQIAHCTEIASVSLDGPEALLMSESGGYTASVSPDDASSPVYTWKVTDPAGKVREVTGSSLTNLFSSEGDHIVKVTASNRCSNKEAQLTVTVTCQPLTAVTVDGVSALLRGESSSFEAVLDPSNASDPIEYTWEVTAPGAAAVKQTETGGSLSYTFATAGDYTIKVTAMGPCGGASGDLTVTVTGNPVTAVTVSGPPLGSLGGSGNFTATVEPDDASQPVTYAWTITKPDGSTATETGRSMSFTFAAAGDYSIQVEAKNDEATVTSAPHAVTVS